MVKNMVSVVTIIAICGGIFFGLFCAMIIFIFPFMKLLWNRWKLKLLVRKGFSPVLICHKNKTMTEIVVDTKDTTFTHNEHKYNIRTEYFYSFNGFNYLVYDEENPEPQRIETLDERVIQVVMPDGTLQERHGKVVDTKLYDQTCNQYYYAGIAFANRNKNLIQILLLVAIGVTVVAGILVYMKTSSTYGMCGTAIRNLTTQVGQVVG
jgi:hypothetical protein